MLPEQVAYHASWMDAENGRCFQIMEAPNEKALQPWISRWDDLVVFEIIPVQTSSDFWSRTRKST